MAEEPRRAFGDDLATPGVTTPGAAQGLPPPGDDPDREVIVGSLSTMGKARWVLLTMLKNLVMLFIPIATVLAAWQLVAMSGIVHPALFPPLQNVWGALVEMAERGLLLGDITRSMYRLLVSVAIGIVVGTTIGLLMGMIRPVERFMTPLMNFGLATPGIAFIPLAILWFGLTDLTIMAILVLEVVLVTMLNTWTAVKGVGQRLIDAARTMGAHGVELFRKVLLPGALPGIIAGYRLGFSRAWRILVAGEMLAGVAAGLGYRIFEARQLFRSDRVYAGIIVIGILGVLLERVVLRTLETVTVERWGSVRDVK